ncbi:MAG TPA: thioesterase family protein [Candidatus Eremiobacteraceae bacterium]|nr:thioesterase family protein [Candidatus Eremiobacteraceae bacterium]
MADSRFKFVRPIKVAFRDIDGMRHVNHAQYLTYAETARNEYWQAITGITDVADFDFVLAELKVVYHAPARLGDELLVGVRITELRRSSWLMEHEIKDAASGRLIAEIFSAQVMYDSRSGKSIPLSDERRRQIEQYEGRALTVLTSKSRTLQ